MQDVYERAGGVTTLVSQGLGSANGPYPATFKGASRDGTRVFFDTSEHLVGIATGIYPDIYERHAGTTTFLSVGPTGGNGDFFAFFGGASDDGTRLFFETDEALVAGDTDISQDVYSSSITTGGVPAPDGRRAAARVAGPGLRRVHGAEPRAWAAARAPLVQPARPVIGTAHGRLAGREPARGELDRLRQAEGRRRQRRHPRRRGERGLHRLDHRCAPEVGPERLHGRAGAGRGAAHHRQAERHGAGGRRHDRRPAVPGHGAVCRDAPVRRSAPRAR